MRGCNDFPIWHLNGERMDRFSFVSAWRVEGQSVKNIGALCEHGCEATFDKNFVHIKNKQSGKIILRVK